LNLYFYRRAMPYANIYRPFRAKLNNINS